MSIYYTAYDGNDITGDGIESAPWKTERMAIEKAVAGDTVIFDRPATDPLRLQDVPLVTLADGVTVKGLDSVFSYATGTIDVSSGASFTNRVLNGDFSAWSSDGKPAFWTPSLGTGGVIEADTGASGGYSAKVTRGSSDYAQLDIDITLPGASEMTLALKHKNNLATKYGAVRLWDRGSGDKLDAAGNWGSSSITLPDSIGSFADYSITFDTNSTGRYTLSLLGLSTSQPVWFDDVSLSFTGTVGWSATGTSNVHSLSDILPKFPTLLKSSASDWTASGMEALEVVDKASSLADCQANKGTYWWESNVLYYNALDTETMADIHFEAGIVNRTDTQQGSGILVGKDSCIFSNIKIYGAIEQGVKITGAAAVLDNCVSFGSFSRGIENSGGSCLVRKCTAEWGHDDGIDCSSGTMQLDRCLAQNNWDEGIEAYLTGVMTAVNCLSLSNGRNGNSGSEGIVATNTSEMTLDRCVSIGNVGCGVGVFDTAKLTMRNSISLDNGYNDVRAAAGTTVISENNTYQNTYDQWETLSGVSPSDNAAEDLAATFVSVQQVAIDYFMGPVRPVVCIPVTLGAPDAAGIPTVV